MEKIVKDKYISLLIVVLFCCNFVKAQQTDGFTIIEESLTPPCGVNGMKSRNLYLDEVAVAGESLSLGQFSNNNEDREFRVHFFSEVEDTFKFYINGVLKETVNINTKPTVNSEGKKENKPIALAFKFADGQTKFDFKMESTKYGCFETEARIAHPMLYLKYHQEMWYIDHSNVFRFPFIFFMRNTRHR